MACPGAGRTRPDWTGPFARTISERKTYVVSSTLESVDWNAELVRGDLRTAIEQLKQKRATAYMSEA